LISSMQLRSRWYLEWWKKRSKL